MSAATLDLRSLWRATLASTKVFIVSTGICVVAGVVLALSMEPRYTATVLLSPAQNDAPGSGLAALAGH